MTEARLFLRENIKSLLHETFENIPVFKTIQLDKNDSIWDKPLLIDGEFYSVCMSNHNNYVIKRLDYYKYAEPVDELEEYGERNIKCPVCGYEELDSWEYTMDSEEMECQYCGSIIEWVRDVSISYNTSVKKINEFKTL